MEKRVVITGLGIISPVGNDVKTFWENLRNGVCGIGPITEFPTDDLPVKIGGRVKDFDPDRYGIDKAFMRKQDWFTIYGVAAAAQAVEDSGLVVEGEGCNIDPFRFGVYVGSGIGGFNVILREAGKFLDYYIYVVYIVQIEGKNGKNKSPKYGRWMRLGDKNVALFTKMMKLFA